MKEIPVIWRHESSPLTDLKPLLGTIKMDDEAATILSKLCNNGVALNIGFYVRREDNSLLSMFIEASSASPSIRIVPSQVEENLPSQIEPIDGPLDRMEV